MRSVKFLMQAKDKLEVTSDAQLALKLRLSKAAVSHYLNGRRVMDDETCLAIALVLNIDPMQVIGAACMDRAEQSGQHSLWEVFMQRGAMAASAVLALAVTFSVTPSSAEAAPLKASHETEARAIHIMSNRMRALLRSLRAKLTGFKRVAMPGTLQPATS